VRGIFQKLSLFTEQQNGYLTPSKAEGGEDSEIEVQVGSIAATSPHGCYGLWE